MAAFADVAYWTAADGARLALRRAPAARPRAALILLHGLGDHAGRYAEAAAWFADHGVSVWALDQRGHGRSPGKRGHVSRFAQFVSDVAALRKLVSAEDAAPQLLLGHSLGAIVVLRYLEAAPEGLAGAIVSSPWFTEAMRVPAWKRALARVLLDLWPTLPVGTGLDVAHLSTDPEVGHAALSDPLYHRVMTPRAYREVRQAQRAAVQEGGRIAVPLLVLLAGDDRIVSRPDAEAFARSLRGDVSVTVYESFFHELFNEPPARRAQVYHDVARWLDHVLAA